MRIVGGEFGGRRFNPPARIPARPTTELAKEALFNMLTNSIDLDGIRALDLFGGTGSISYELASHGAAHITVVERDPISIDFIKKTAETLHIQDRLQIIRGDVFKYLKQCTDKFDLIFADPPYALANMDEVPQLINVLAAEYEQLLQTKAANARAFVAGLREFGHGHQELADQIDKLDFKQLVAIARTHADELRKIIESFHP